MASDRERRTIVQYTSDGVGTSLTTEGSDSVVARELFRAIRAMLADLQRRKARGSDAT